MYNCYITPCMMNTTERVVLDQLQPKDITQDFCDQHGISMLSADHCSEQQLELLLSNHQGQICILKNIFRLIGMLIFFILLWMLYFSMLSIALCYLFFILKKANWHFEINLFLLHFSLHQRRAWWCCICKSRSWFKPIPPWRPYDWWKN